ANSNKIHRIWQARLDLRCLSHSLIQFQWHEHLVSGLFILEPEYKEVQEQEETLGADDDEALLKRTGIKQSSKSASAYVQRLTEQAKYTTKSSSSLSDRMEQASRMVPGFRLQISNVDYVNKPKIVKAMEASMRERKEQQRLEGGSDDLESG